MPKIQTDPLPQFQIQAQYWQQYYNNERPHSALNYQTPAEFRSDWEKRRKPDLTAFEQKEDSFLQEKDGFLQPV